MLWKNKAHIGVCWILVTAITVLVVYKIPTVYRAESLILVDSQKIPENMVTATVQTDVQDRLATLSQQIQSRTRLLKIINALDLYSEERKTHLQEDVIEMMRAGINVKIEKGWTRERTGAFRVSYEARDPAIAAEVANRIANLYIEENLRAREVQAEGTSDFLENQLEQAKKSLEGQEASLREYKLLHNGDLPQQENSPIAVLMQLKVQLQGNEDATYRAEQSKLLLENALGSARATELTLSQAADQVLAAAAQAGAASPADPARTAQQDSYRTLRAELEQARRRYTDDHPDVKRLEAEVTSAQRLQDQPVSAAPKEKPVLAAIRPDLAEGIIRQKELVASLRTQLALIERDLGIRATERKEIESKTAAAQAKIEKLPIREQEMAALTRDYEISKANYQSLLDKKLAAGLATEMERRQKAERFTVLDAARVPEKPYKPNRRLLDAMGCGLGLLLGISFAIGKEFQSNVLLGEWELPSHLYVLGRVARIDTVGVAPRPGRFRGSLVRRRAALVSSAVLSLLGAIAVLLYYVKDRL